MNKRKLKKILEANNALSPDIPTVTVFAETPAQAWRIAGIFEEVTGEDLPMLTDSWRKTLQAPVELYFVFRKIRQKNRFIKKMEREFPETEMIA